MKFYFKIICICTMLLGMTGCSLFPTGEEYSWGEKEADVTISDNSAVGKLNDAISVDTKINIPENTDWKEYTASIRKYTDDAINNISNELKGSNYVTKVKKEDGYYYCEYSDGGSYTYVCNDGLGYTVKYNSKQNIKTQYASMLESTNGSTLSDDIIKEMFPDENIDELSKEEAERMAVEICKKMQINISETPYLCIAMDYENANKAIDENNIRGMDKYGNIKYWDNSDDAYYMTFQQKINNVPLAVASKSSNFFEISTSSVTVVVGRAGVLLVENHGLYDCNDSKNVTVIEPQEVIDKIATDTLYAAVDNMALIDMSLEYAVYHDMKTDEYVIKPMWIYTFERTAEAQKDGETYTKVSRQVYFMDAVTGEVLSG